jgi:hypothetical protein
MNRTFAMFVLIYLFLIAVGVSAQEEKNSSPTTKEAKAAIIPGEWELKPLAIKGAPAPGTGGRFEFFLGPFNNSPVVVKSVKSPNVSIIPIDPSFNNSPVWVESGITAFWESFGPKKDDWALYSIKDGKVTKILVEEEPLPAVGTDKAKVSGRRDAVPDMEMQPLVAGKNLLYINAWYSRRVSSLRSAVYTWDGENLKLLLGNDSQLEINGVTHNVYRAYAQATPDGKVIIHGWTDKPQKVFFWLVHDGKKLTLIPNLSLQENKPLPGMPEVMIDSYRYIWTIYSSVASFDGGEVAILKVKGASYKEALFRITPEKTEKILAVGDPDPSDSTQKIRELISVFAADKNNVAFAVRSGKQNNALLLLYRNGKFQKVFDHTQIKDWNSTWFKFIIEGGFFLDPESPNYFFKVILERKSKFKVRGYYYEPVPHYFFFDGEKVHQLSETAPTTLVTAPVLSSSLGKGAVETNGVLLRWVGGKLVGGAEAKGSVYPYENWMADKLTEKLFGKEVSDSIFIFDTTDLVGGWLLEKSGKEFSFKPAPEFNVKGRKVSLGNVAGWKSPTEAIVRLDDGIYLLSKLQ